MCCTLVSSCEVVVYFGVDKEALGPDDVNLQTEKLHCNYTVYHKWSLTICDGCFDTLKSSKMRS